MSALTLSIRINSNETDGNPESWEWLVDSNTSSTNPPPRMSPNDTIQFQVVDDGGATSLDAYMIMGPKVENPLTGVTGPASPLKQGNVSSNNAICVATWSGVAPAGTVFTFTPPSNTLLSAGAWEVTLVISCPATGTQFELDPEFDVSTGN